jgi:hypothetical protein
MAQAAAVRRSGPGWLGLLLLALVLVVPVALALSALGGAIHPSATGAPLTTGVQGQVLAGPTCPVELSDAALPGAALPIWACQRPVSGAVLVAFGGSGREVGRAVSDAQGYYFLGLPPGTYQIVPQPVEGLMGTAPPFSVTVTAGTPTLVEVTYDTGIRLPD